MITRVRGTIDILLRLIQMAINFVLSAARFGLNFPLAWIKRERMTWQTSLGIALADFCVRSGATFIKMGQLLSTRQDLLPPEMLPPLLRLQDRVAPFPYNKVAGILKRQFGRSVKSIFAEFEPEVVASASIANVYKARLHDGRVVAVKIRRPGIARQMHNDLRIMKLGSGWMAKLPTFRLVPVAAVMSEFSQAIVQQLDFRREADNNRRFQKCFVGNGKVKIPQLVDELCTREVLTMEYIPNLRGINLGVASQGEYKEALITGLRALYRMIFTEGFVHCDLHTGNLYLREDGSVVILDTGFVAAVSRKDQYEFVNFFFAIASNDGVACARILYDTATYKSPEFDKAEFDKAIIALIGKSTGAKASAFEVAQFVGQLFDLQRRHGLRGTSNFILIILSLLVFEGLAKLVYPDLDFQGESIPFLTPILFEQRLSERKVYVPA